MTPYRAPGRPDLGPVLSREHARRWTAAGCFWATMFLVAAGIPAVFAPAMDFASPLDRTVLRVTAGLVAVAVVGVAAWSFRHRRDEIFLYQGGCTLRWNGVETTFAWDDVVACRTSPVVIGAEAPLDLSTFDLVLRSGARLSVPPHERFFEFIAPSRERASIVKRATERALVRAARETFERGEAIDFSEVQAHPERGLSSRGHVLPWSDVADVEVDQDGFLTIHRRPREAWGAFNSAHIENLDLLLVLLAARGTLPARD